MSGPSVTPSLEGVRGKLGRAKDHLEELKRVLKARPNTEAFQVPATDPQTQERLIQIAVKDAPEVSMTARLLIGDVVHALAASLDHLVYQLSLSHQIAVGTPDPVAVCDDHRTHFPIFTTPKDGAERLSFEKRIDKRLELMAQPPADLIRGMQPYKRTEADTTLDPAAEPLWILFKLDVIDKHRVVLTTAEHAKPTGILVSHPDEGTEMIPIPNAEWQPFKHGQKLLTLGLGHGQAPKPGTKLNLHLEAEVRFAETGLWCDDKPIVALLTKLIGFIEKAIVNNLAPFVV